MWFVLIWFCCQVFYYEDETTTDFEVAKVTQSYVTGINKAIHSSVRVDIYGTMDLEQGMAPATYLK